MDILLSVNEIPPQLVQYFEPVRKLGPSDVWTIPTQGFSDAHFAVFPEKLVEPCIKAGTSAKGCCPKCGAGWVRVVERSAMVIDRSSRTHDKGRTRTSGTMLEPPQTQTTGWRPGCECNAGEPIPCTVLDPFAGSGTVGVVAWREGRDFVGIELSPEYAGMVEKRIGKAARPASYRDMSQDQDAPLFTQGKVEQNPRKAPGTPIARV